jgi:hypothetical protein
MFNSVWFAVVTVSSVGYGDMVIVLVYVIWRLWPARARPRASMCAIS